MRLIQKEGERNVTACMGILVRKVRDGGYVIGTNVMDKRLRRSDVSASVNRDEIPDRILQSRLEVRAREYPQGGRASLSEVQTL